MWRSRLAEKGLTRAAISDGLGMVGSVAERTCAGAAENASKAIRPFRWHEAGSPREHLARGSRGRQVLAPRVQSALDPHGCRLLQRKNRSSSRDGHS